ncbi:hypothetical protein MSAN_01032000 [Mycena sanguinolenta]|uniref:XPG-I domain-containing protein n=1 Tax=Mycena sanguinolenta TaxID=230812 RepID=A0A8H6YRW4_9AGAR|nr:hypothetical protein MSAN_01032000 [Mycena sanguinolenta]
MKLLRLSRSKRVSVGVDSAKLTAKWHVSQNRIFLILPQEILCPSPRPKHIGIKAHSTNLRLDFAYTDLVDTGAGLSANERRNTQFQPSLKLVLSDYNISHKWVFRSFIGTNVVRMSLRCLWSLDSHTLSDYTNVCYHSKCSRQAASRERELLPNCDELGTVSPRRRQDTGYEDVPCSWQTPYREEGRPVSKPYPAGLWKELEPIEQKISLHDLAVGTGFIANPTGAHGFRIGIDASGWMYRACSLHGTTENPELVALFSRCSRLFRLPFIPIFVFDGPGRPSSKRGKLVRGNNHSLAAPFQQMLDGFGFQWITAPGEAEATLSEMSSIGVPVSVDAILTDDSDSFVFGAGVVLRIRSEDNESYSASRYSAFDIAQVLGLSREDFILIAILAGGDYSDGLLQCGIRTAIGLARAGLGRQLASGLSGRSDHASRAFLATWREALRMELQTNTSGCLPHQYPKLAANIPSDFPDLDIVKLYLYPLVSGPSAMQPLVLRPPRLDILARFAEDHFVWGDSIGILDHFVDQLFAGLVIRELVDRASAVGQHSSSIIRRLVGDRNHKSTGYLAELRLMLNLDANILTAALQAIIGRRDPELGAQADVSVWIATKLPKVRVWVPSSMVEHVYPDIVLDYICAKTSKPARKNKPKVRQRKSRSDAALSSAGNLQGRPRLSANQQGPSNSYGSTVRREKRYSKMEITYCGEEEVLELITDSEAEF